MSLHPINRESKFLATLDKIDWRIPVVEYLAGKPQGTAMARISQLLALKRGATIELTAGESCAADRPMQFPLTDDESIAWGLALAAIHMLPNRERIWI